MADIPRKYANPVKNNLNTGCVDIIGKSQSDFTAVLTRGYFE
jgi:hypothetical protein